MGVEEQEWAVGTLRGGSWKGLFSSLSWKKYKRFVVDRGVRVTWNLQRRYKRGHTHC